MKTIHIEKKHHDADRAAASIRDALLARGDESVEITPADASTLSGVPLYDAEPGLIALAHTYPSRIRVTEQGDLLFSFDSLQHQRDTESGPLMEALRAVSRWFARHRLKFYAVFTLLLLPPLMLAAAANIAALGALLPQGVVAVVLGLPLFMIGGLLFCAGALGVIFLQVFPILAIATLLAAAAIMVTPIFADDVPLWTIIIFVPLGGLAGAGGLWMGAFAWEAYKSSVAGDSGKWARDMWLAFGGFAFGPLAEEVDALADERALTGLIARKQGVLSVWDLVELFGWSERLADQQLTRILVDYGGDVVVTDEGAIVYVFEPMLRGAGNGDPNADASEATSLAEARLGDSPRFFGSSKGVTRFIGTLTVVPLLGVLLHPDLRIWPSIEHYHWLAQQNPDLPVYLGEGIGAIPYLIVLAGPVLRVPLWFLSRARWRRRRDLLAGLRQRLGDRDVVEARAACAGLRDKLMASDRDLGAIVFDTALGDDA